MSLIRGDALTIPLADNTVDLIVTSPPYFALRSYTDACETCGGIAATNGTPITGGTERSTLAAKGPQHYQTAAVEPDPDCPACEGSGRGHYAGQLGSEATPAAFIDALVSVTRECVRVLKPSGSLFVNLGDKYAGSQPGSYRRDTQPFDHQLGDRSHRLTADNQRGVGDVNFGSIPTKSLMGLPWRYALRCIDDLGLILRAEIIWSKPNGLPESVQDRVRRSHEQWFHFTLEPRYYSAVDEIREEPATIVTPSGAVRYRTAGDPLTSEHEINRGVSLERQEATGASRPSGAAMKGLLTGGNPLGKLPGSVWTVPTEPLQVPDDLPQHFAAFPSEWPRRIILGWSPSGICVECGQGRRPVTEVEFHADRPPQDGRRKWGMDLGSVSSGQGTTVTPGTNLHSITGESCACPTPDAPTRKAVVLDPFAGTGTSVAVANALGRYGVGLDLSADYLRLARWRCNDPGLRAKALGVDKPTPEVPGQMALL